MKNYLSAVFLTFLVGCAPLKIGVIEKKIEYSGQKSGNAIIKYTGEIKIINSLIIKEIKLKNYNENLKFHFVNKLDGMLFNSTKTLPKGEYYIQIYTQNMELLKKSNDTLIFIIDNGKKDIVIQKNVIFSKEIYMK